VRAGRRPAALCLAALCLLLAACGGGSPGPATGAARLVPAGALVYLHVSTDSSRDVVASASRLANRFPSYPRLRDAILGRLSASGGPVDIQRDVRPWLGREAAIALLDSGGATAGSLVVIDVSDRSRARAFLQRSQSATSSTYSGTTIQTLGSVSVAFVGHYLVIGQDATVRQAIDLAAGRGRSLADNPTFASATRGLPSGRVADGYMTAGGTRSLLAPQGGLLGLAGTLLNHPALIATGLALSPAGGGARLMVHEVLDPALQRSAPPAFQAFSPSLASAVPASALAYLGVAGLDRAVGRLLGAAGRSGAALGAILARARGTLSAPEVLSLAGDLKALLGGQVAIWVTPGSPTPSLAVLTAAEDEASARVDLARLQGPLTRLFTVPGAGPGQAPTFDQRSVAGIGISSLRLAPGLELDYAIQSHRLVIATAVAPILAALGPGPRLVDKSAYTRALSDRPSRVTSLLFLDFSQLLALGEQTGLSSSAAYARIRNDLQLVKAVGESSSGGVGQTTAEIFLSIP
jgi:Protein of unknown function (DUF3352)